MTISILASSILAKLELLLSGLLLRKLAIFFHFAKVFVYKRPLAVVIGSFSLPHIMDDGIERFRAKEFDSLIYVA